MSCAALVAEYAKADPSYAVFSRGKWVARCFHCQEEAYKAEDIPHAWSCFWARCVRHEKPTVKVG
jgi:formylglycine-generating enzyme required for sulfatase activity